MRLEILNYSQLVTEQDRISQAVPRVSEMAGKLGTEEGPERYRYDTAKGLDLVGRIDHVGNLRFRMHTIALPAFEKRQQAIDKLITEYPQRLQRAEATVARMKEQPEGKYTPQELSLAEQALIQARLEFQAPPIKELAAQVTAPAIISPTPEPFKHLKIIEGERGVILTLIFEGEEPKVGEIIQLTPMEFMALNALIRARIVEQRRLTPAELAERAFVGKTASEVGLNKIIHSLRAKLNSSGHEFLNSAGAVRGPAVQYGIAEDVFIKSDDLQQEKEKVERLDKLRKLMMMKKNTPMASLFEKLAAKLGEKVAVESICGAKDKIHNLRVKLEGIEGIEGIEGKVYKIKTFRTKRDGVSYSLVEIPVPASVAPPVSEKIDQEKEKEPGVVRDREVTVVVAAPALPGVQAPEKEAKDPFAQIKRKDSQVARKVEDIANRVIASKRPFFIVPEIEDLFNVRDHVVEKAIENRRVKPVWVEGHHGMLSPGDVVYLIALVDYKFNLTNPERKQLRKLVKKIMDKESRQTNQSRK